MESALVRSSPAALTDLSTLKICKLLWHHRISLSYLRSDEELLQDLVFLLAPPEFHLPNSLRGAIDCCLKIMGTEAQTWIKIHNGRVLKFTQDEPVRTSLLCLVWRTDATIDYIETAHKLLECAHLSSETKFQVAKFYFFKDHLYQLQPELSEVELRKRINPSAVLQFKIEICMRSSRHVIIQLQERFEDLVTWWYDRCFEGADHVARQYFTTSSNPYLNSTVWQMLLNGVQ